MNIVHIGFTPPDGSQMPGGFRDGGQFAQRGQDQNGPQGAAAPADPAVSLDALALTGVSALFLLAGIFVALKVKH